MQERKGECPTSALDWRPMSKAASCSEIVERLTASLRRQGSPERAAGEKRYLKSDLQFFGVPVPVLRRMVRNLVREHRDLDRETLVTLVERLWSAPVFELRRAAVVMLVLRSELLEARDIGVVERLLRESRTWALVDELAARVASGLYERFRAELDREMERWQADGDFWIRRSALLVHLIPLREGRGDFERFARAAEKMLDEREFFVRKAIGWVLRETAKRRPEMVAEWLEPRAADAAGLTVREAVKHMPEELGDWVLAARRRARCER
jgi:3-methyladenine DNA glycosylase AlkD